MTRRRHVLVAAATAASLTLALTVADLVVERKAEEKIVEVAECRLGDASDVTADLGDTLAGLRTVTGRVGTVHIHAGRVHRAGVDMALQASLYGVSTDGGATSGSASATVSYAQLGERLDGGAGGMRPGSDGTHLTLTGTAGDLGVPVTVLTDLSTTAHSVTITPAAVSLMGREVPVSALSSLPGAAQLAGKLKPRKIDMGKLPEGARLTGARPGPEGLTLDFGLSAKDVAGANRETAATACAPTSEKA
ncbi:LmeA family phospholipid-binding protein [Streptomyces sp. NPDC023723]|uniref:LmeA family phospholipid-binding protein n=1 Tax=Streptomyces sp. NPDC023723 TaxID=3154323 RepID=UPI0033E8397B